MNRFVTVLIVSLLDFALQAENSFQVTLFKMLCNDTKQSNVVISPLSIYQGLAFLSNGARGETQKEIIRTINEKDLVELNKANQEMTSFFDKEKLLKIANGVLSTTTPNESFIQSQINTKHFLLKLNQRINQSIQLSEQTIKSLMSSLQLIIFK